MRTAWAAVAAIALVVSVFSGVQPAHAAAKVSLVPEENALVTSAMSSKALTSRFFAECSFVYVVRRGDTLARLTPSWVSVARHNHIARPNVLTVGEKLCLTRGEANTFYNHSLVTGMIVSVRQVTNKTVKQNTAPVLSVQTTQTTQTQSTNGASTGGQPCSGAQVVWPANMSMWQAPTGCFGQIFAPNPGNYVARPGFGWCNWWPEVLHPTVTGLLQRARSSAAVPGAVVWFAPGVYGASSEGHWAQVVAIHSGWMLITEMNFTWRGGGFARVDYRFVPIGSGESFIVI